MKDRSKTKEQLIEELQKARQKVSVLEAKIGLQEHVERAQAPLEWHPPGDIIRDTVKGERGKPYEPPYGDLTALNTSHMILDLIGKDVLTEIVADYLDLLETSGAIYEINGDYALGIFSSGWCRLLDTGSRKLCDTDDNRVALDSGKWHCHESCWRRASKVSIETGQAVDIECYGGIHLYAIPIWAGGEIVGSMSFGYGDPPSEPEKLRKIADRYRLEVGELLGTANSYKSRPEFIVDFAKKRLHTAAKLVGTIIQLKPAEGALKKWHECLEEKVNVHAGELTDVSKRLEHEINERKQMQERLLRQERLAVLGELAGGVGHELRNPMGVISNAVYYLKTILSEADETTREYLEIISSEIRRSEKIVSDLLNLSRTRPAEKEEIKLPRLVARVLEKQQPPPWVDVTVEMADDLPLVLADPQQIGQVLTNLLSNAGAAMPKGGSLDIRAKSENDSVYLSVSDTGCGIADEVADKIFEPLFTTKARGIGLGLTVSKNLVEVNGGSIEVKSKEGRGSTFTITLPIREAQL